MSQVVTVVLVAAFIVALAVAYRLPAVREGREARELLRSLMMLDGLPVSITSQILHPILVAASAKAEGGQLPVGSGLAMVETPGILDEYLEAIRADGVTDSEIVSWYSNAPRTD